MDDASRAQVEAADPATSTWLSANAGSGKTRVLIDRVARLLLRGTPPQRILCLTYTNAAASEMQNRLFKRLGEWAMMPEERLAETLAALGMPAAERATEMVEARRLFARAIETPGGLRIQTIHSFCASLLRRFPLEAGVPPQFTEIDERSAAQLVRAALEEMAEGPDARLVAGMAGLAGEETFFRLVDRIVSLRRGLVPRDAAEIRRVLGLTGVSDPVLIAGEALRGVSREWWGRLLDRLAQGGPIDRKVARKLARVNLDRPDRTTLPLLEDALLAKSGEREGLPSNGEPTAAMRRAEPALLEPLLQLAQRVSDLRPQRQAAQAAEAAAVLSDFARAFLPMYARAKARRGWLDFDDLIEKAEALLTDPAVAAWVLFRLDGGIDHILVDEAQDTSPEQWRVIDLLTQEFTAGLGARHRERTLFVVGDKKQSIYSFQGADVSGFDRRAELFRLAFETVGLGFANRDLRHSFRSSPVILALVDRLFASGQADAVGQDVRHIAFNNRLPGRIEVWPVVPRPEKDDAAGHWSDPVDQPSAQAPEIILAAQIAARIKQMIGSAPVPQARGATRPAQPGDFLILVRRRSGVFPHLIRACKAAGLPVAGADRLKLTEELAVNDLLALLSVLATPEDDLSLACVLRSPLCGWSEADLFALAHGRKGYLWEALRQGDSAARAMLQDLRDQADYLRPHDLLDRALTRHRGRVRLLARLGEEVAESIDALLALALAYEQVEVPSLDGFLLWMQGGDATIKRQMGASAGRIRIMTVHGAKGLESPIVILPDTGDRRPDGKRTILLDGNGLPFLTGSAGDLSRHVADLIEAKRARDEQESLRLLYVALTRAETQLIVAAAGEAKAGSWHGLVQEAALALGARPDAEGRLVLASPDWPLTASAAVETAVESLESAGTEPLPAWAATRAPPAQARVTPLSPSDLGGAKTLSGQTVADADATARGTALHLLLQHLPGQDAARWPMLAAALVPDAGLRSVALAAAARLILDSDLAPIFGPGSLAEVTIQGELAGRPAEGSIDRLVVTDRVVLAVDFKSNVQVPEKPEDVPEAILRQMAAYAALLAQAYPGRTVRTAILWTETGRLMALDDDIMREALARATSTGVPALDGRDGQP